MNYIPIRLALIVLTCLIFNGCTSVKKNVTPDYVFNEHSANGLLLASVTYQGGFAGYEMRFRKLGTDDVNALQIGEGGQMVIPAWLDWDIELNGQRGNVFAVELPPGKYEFMSWIAVSGGSVSRPQEKFILPFEIKAGESVYFGNFNFTKHSFLGGYTADLQSKKGRDLTLLSRKYSNIDLKTTVREIKATIANIGGGSTTDIYTPIIVQ